MLKKELGLLDVFCIASGTMISSGLFVLPGIVFAEAGPAIVFSYALAGLLMIPSMLSKAELATAMPKSGGSYFFIERSLGPLAGTIAGLANWFSIALKATFALIGIGALGAFILPQSDAWTVKLIAMGACLLFAVVNLVSTKSSGRLQTILALGLLAIMVIYSGAGMVAVKQERFFPFMTSDIQSIVAVAGMVFVSFGGLTKVASVAEEIRDPGKTLPLGMFLAFVVVNILYVVVVFVTIGTIDARVLSGSLVPLTLGAKATMGYAGEIVISLGAFMAFASTANAGILAASRSPLAMSRDGLLPAFFAKTTAKSGVPFISVIITSAAMILVIPLLSIKDLVKTASTMMILMFMFVNVAVIIMRESGFQSYRPPYKAPFYPWLQISAILIYGFLIVDMGAVPLILTASFALLACLWYIGYVRPRIDRESALVFMVKNIVSKDIQRSGLEQELRQLSLERDGVTLDRFDHLIHKCTILDIEEQLTARELFCKVADSFSQDLNLDQKVLYELLLAREMQTSTVVAPGLAIPHIIVEGEDIFEVMLVRVREGAVFSDLNKPVRTVFVLVGSMDQRNYHLRALMTIARIVQEAGFEERWEKAQNSEQLRDVVLLSSREREKHP